MDDNNEKQEGLREELPKFPRRELKWAVYDTIRRKLVDGFLYESETAAVNQARRGASNWVIISVEILYDPSKVATLCRCNCCR